MDIVELLRRCQGTMSQTEFADLLGVSRSLLSMIYSGQRKAGKSVLTALARQFPETRDVVVELFFALDSHDSEDDVTDSDMPNGNGQPAPCSAQ